MEKNTDIRSAVEILKKGGVGVLATDTLYGLVGSAFSSEAVDRVYKLKQRDRAKPFIVLVSCIEDLEKFGIALTAKLIEKLKQYWPGPYSILLPVASERFAYLHRGTHRIAFRLPDKKDLLEILQQTGPLVAPSANLEGMPPAQNIEEARNYFGANVDFYVDGGEFKNKASTILSFEGDEIFIKRK
jgi:L-threonylcarbamoyladenylate synthase